MIRLVLEKLPLLMMSVAILFVTAKAQAASGAMVDLQSVPLSQRLANVPVAYVRYLGKMVWFGNLTVFYPMHPWPVPAVVAASVLLITITAISLYKLRCAPWLIVGWLWFR
jgi:hypothetical protein